MWHIILFFALTLLSCTYALWRGGRDEKICAWIMIAATLVTRFTVPIEYFRFYAIEPGPFVIDAAMMAALTMLALRSNRFWPLWMAGFQGYSIVAHVARILTPTVGPKMYAIGQGLMCYPMMLLLVIAVVRHPAARETPSAS
jgi:hypothetical protein